MFSLEFRLISDEWDIMFLYSISIVYLNSPGFDYLPIYLQYKLYFYLHNK